MDRFQLVNWFRGKTDGHPNYDACQIIHMVEDFLNLLIICATEHGYASDTSIEQRVRRSIIQYIGIGSMAYSELLKLVPESLSEHESFESQLNMIANYKAPDGLSDKGLYEIKPEYLDEIEPYYWHYTRNQREEAQNVLKERWNQLNPDNKVDDKEEFLLIPKNKHIEIGPFRYLRQFLHSHIVCQIIAYALWDAKFHNASKSDTILDEALYLAMLAVTDPIALAAMKVKGKFRADVLSDESNINHFIDFAENDEYSIQINEIEKTRASLLVILLRCLDDPELAHAHKRLGFIVDKIEYHGSDAAKERIVEYKERKYREMKTELERTGDNGTSEYERKKAAAKARQAAIMSQFANAQFEFMEQHTDLYKTEEDEDIRESYEGTATAANEFSSEDDMEIVRKCHFPADNCIVCQEELDDSKLFGMLGLIQQSNTQRLSPLNNKDVLADVLKTSNSTNSWGPKDENNTDILPPFSGFPTDAHLSGLDISSCGHLMHSECFDDYQKSIDTRFQDELGRILSLTVPAKRFLCPLCKALGNVLVPIVWKGKKEAHPGVMVPSTPYTDLTRTVKEAAEELKKCFEQIPGSFDEELPFISNDPDLVINDQKKLKRIYNKLMKIMHDTMGKSTASRPSNLPDSIRNLYDMYSYTISNFETAQRGTEGTRARDLTVEHTGTFIDDIPSTSQTLLKVLGMTNTLIQKLMNSTEQAEDSSTNSSGQTKNRFIRERLALQAINQFIPNTANRFIQDMVEVDTFKPLLVDDTFKALVRLSFSVTECPSIETHHLLRSIYLAELSKTVIAIASSFLNGEKLLKDNKISQLLRSLNTDQHQSPEAETVQQFATYVLGLVMPQASIDLFFRYVHPGALASLVRTFVLPFLRKSLLFMVVHHGFILQDPSNEMQDKNEFDNLLDILRLPSLVNLFELQAFEQEMISGWCQDYLKYSQTENQTSLVNGSLTPISLNLPTRFRMTTLPHRLDQLLDESLKRVCRTCKTVPEHSAICLICGTFVCARRFCCTKDDKGECNTHMKR
jgi:E3 ubiquitin-protein ligase UBR1